MYFKKLFAITFISFCFIAALTAQTQSVKTQSRTEKSVEDEYLSNVEDVIIDELASSDEYDSKWVALQYIENALNSGRKSKEMVASLGGLAGEGITTQKRNKGRLMNNYPDVRAKACDLLGEIPTEESKNILYTIANEDKEPMVVAAAVRSLGNIGINNNDEVINMIEFVQRKYAALNSTDSLALEILFTYEKLAPTVQNKSAMIESIKNIAVNHNYKSTVKAKAYQLLKALSESDKNSSESAM